MIKPLEQLADSFSVINYNIRELLFKLYIWNTTSDATVTFILRKNENPFTEQFTIPSRSSISSSLQTSWLNPRRVAPSVKNWGRYTKNIELQSPIIFKKTISQDINYFCYDGDFDIHGAIQIKLSNDLAVNGDIFEFISTVAVSFDPSDNNLIEFLDNSNNVILGCGNSPVSQFADETIITTSIENLTYKASFQFIVEESTGVGQWVVFDFNLFPNYQYDSASSGGAFVRYSSFKDPTLQ